MDVKVEIQSDQVGQGESESPKFKTRRGMRVYKTNPFLAELDEDVRRKPIFNKSQDLALVHRDTGLLKEVSLTTYKEVSKEKFVNQPHKFTKIIVIKYLVLMLLSVINYKHKS